MAELARAYFIRTADEGGGSGAGGAGAAPAEGSGVSNAPASVPARAVPVQFNPLSLQYGLTINNPQPGAQPASTQHVARAEATLEMDLIFDTTHDGSDVRALTVPVRNLAMADAAPSAAGAGSGAAGGTGSGSGTSTGSNAADPAPPKVAFVWGTFRFVGVVSGFRETLDFFAAEGVPLRSGVHVSLRGTQNSEAFKPAKQTAALGSGLGQSLGSLGRQDASAGRAAGAALGAASLRVGLGASASAGASASVGAGGGVGLNAGLSVGASAGISAGVGASVSVGAGASAASTQAALGQLAQLNAQSQAGAATPLGGAFGFGGAAQGSEPSGLRSRLGVLDFSATGS